MRHDAPCLRTDDPPSRPAGRLGVTTWVVRREREGYTRLVTATDYNTGTRRHTPIPGIPGCVLKEVVLYPWPSHDLNASSPALTRAHALS